MKSLPIKTNVIEYGLITWERWKSIHLCDECLEDFINKDNPRYGYNKIREYDFDTCQMCGLDTEKKHHYMKNLKTPNKRS